MREILSKIQQKKRPLSMAHMASNAHGPENSRQAILNCLQYNPDIIEIDVRKSRIGELFCHHGAIPFGIIFSQFLYFFSFNTIRKFFTTVNTPVELLEVIPDSTIVYLDIKDRHISVHDILELRNKFKTHNIWIATYSLKQLKKLRTGLGEDYIYVFNRPVIFFNIFLDRAKGIADVIQLFIWQWNDKNVQRANQNGFFIHLARWFYPLSKKFKFGNKHNNLWLVYDDLRFIQK